MTKLVTRDTLQGSLTENAQGIVSADALTHAEMDKNFFPIAIAINGNVEANKAVVVDGTLDADFGSGDISATDITATGALTADTSIILNGSTALTSVDVDLIGGVSGSDDTLATAKAIAAYADSVGVTRATSTAYTTYAASTVLAAKSHGLTGQPDVVMAVMKCTTTDAGYAVDDYVTLDYSTGRGVTVWSSATQFGGTVGTASIRIPHKSTAADTTITAGSWEIYIKAIKF